MTRLALFLITAAVTFAVEGQTYPSRPVCIVVPLSQGGFADPLARVAGVEATVMAPEPLAAFMRAEHEKWGRVVRETGATVN